MLLLINNIGYAYHDKTHKPTKGIAIVPMDVNGNGKLDEEEKFYGTLDELMEAIAKGKYPAPPARNLYLVCNGRKTEEPSCGGVSEVCQTKRAAVECSCRICTYLIPVAFSAGVDF